MLHAGALWPLLRSCEPGTYPAPSGVPPSTGSPGVETAVAAKLLGRTPEVMLRLYREATLGDVREAARQAALDTFPRGEAVPFPDKRTG